MKKPTGPRFNLTAGDRTIMQDVGPLRHDLFAKYYFDVELFPWQHYFLDYPCKNKLAVAGIRTGKSFVAAYELLSFSYWHPGARCLNVCITADQAQIIFNDILMLAQQPRFEHWVDKITQHPYPVVKLANGSEIWSRSIGGASGDASTIRGWEFDVINVDEAAYVVNEIAIKTLQGRLIGVNKQTRQPRYGLLSLTTTPKGAKTWLFDRWKKGDPQYPQSQPEKYLSLRARTYDNTLLDPATIEEALGDYTEKQRQQELEGLFVSDDGLYAFEDLMRMCGKDLGEDILDLTIRDPYSRDLEVAICSWLEKIKGKRPDGVPQDIEYYELDPEPGHLYVAGWDLGARAVLSGKAEGRNATVGVVYDITTRPWRLVAYRYDTQGRYTISMARVKSWHDLYNKRNATCFTRIDALGPGDVIHQMLEEDQYRIDGFKASTLSKGTILQASSVAIEKSWIRTPFIRRMIDQFQAYDPDDKHLAQDIVIACSQAIHLAREIEGVRSIDPEVRQPEHNHGSSVDFRRASRIQRTKRATWGRT